MGQIKRQVSNSLNLKGRGPRLLSLTTAPVEMPQDRMQVHMAGSPEPSQGAGQITVDTTLFAGMSYHNVCTHLDSNLFQ